MKIAVIGQSVFGQEVYKELRKDGHTIVGVFTIPDKDGKADPLGKPLGWTCADLWPHTFTDCFNCATCFLKLGLLKPWVKLIWINRFDSTWKKKRNCNVICFGLKPAATSAVSCYLYMKEEPAVKQVISIPTAKHHFTCYVLVCYSVYSVISLADPPKGINKVIYLYI